MSDGTEARLQLQREVVEEIRVSQLHYLSLIASGARDHSAGTYAVH
ncbi:MAG: hypothetical protein KJ947_07480 [Alphaproteobacteria bacterium]|nr:hypothetical protein [Alphaproteobacteria bacterium]MBU1549403.1 hypothetical protein [Alphaproteobacteria bacterium]MBU2338168.1 hypothetical protein [Alphaproteobacteria bacterium]MBU2387555.1 hypothetical protein [Alphaproteobacteria bacterium]